jgi:hypothetical protein
MYELHQALPAAEPEVIKLLTSMNRDICLDACRILETVGTKASLAPLAATAKMAIQRQQPHVASAANAAAQAISRR